jgi:hypothetical protein
MARLEWDSRLKYPGPRRVRQLAKEVDGPVLYTLLQVVEKVFSFMPNPNYPHPALWFQAIVRAQWAWGRGGLYLNKQEHLADVAKLNAALRDMAAAKDCDLDGIGLDPVSLDFFDRVRSMAYGANRFATQTLKPYIKARGVLLANMKNEGAAFIRTADGRSKQVRSGRTKKR